MNNSMSKFEIGDGVVFSENVTQEDFDYVGLDISIKESKFLVAALDPETWGKYVCGGIITECGRYIPSCLLTKVMTAQQKLDKLKKYFESGNNVPVQQATIKAKDFWAIYNS
jgi:hypothetical protein